MRRATPTTPRARALPVRAALGALVAFVAFFASALRPPALPEVPHAVASIAQLAGAPHGEVVRAERGPAIRKVTDVRETRADGADRRTLDAGLAPAVASWSRPVVSATEARMAALVARAPTPKRHDELMVFLN